MFSSCQKFWYFLSVPFILKQNLCLLIILFHKTKLISFKGFSRYDFLDNFYVFLWIIKITMKYISMFYFSHCIFYYIYLISFKVIILNIVHSFIFCARKLFIGMKQNSQCNYKWIRTRLKRIPRGWNNVAYYAGSCIKRNVHKVAVTELMYTSNRHNEFYASSVVMFTVKICVFYSYIDWY